MDSRTLRLTGRSRVVLAILFVALAVFLWQWMGRAPPVSATGVELTLLRPKRILDIDNDLVRTYPCHESRMKLRLSCGDAEPQCSGLKSRLQQASGNSTPVGDDDPASFRLTWLLTAGGKTVPLPECPSLWTPLVTPYLFCQPPAASELGLQCPADNNLPVRAEVVLELVGGHSSARRSFLFLSTPRSVVSADALLTPDRLNSAGGDMFKKTLVCLEDAQTTPAILPECLTQLEQARKQFDDEKEPYWVFQAQWELALQLFMHNVDPARLWVEARRFANSAPADDWRARINAQTYAAWWVRHVGYYQEAWGYLEEAERIAGDLGWEGEALTAIRVAAQHADETRDRSLAMTSAQKCLSLSLRVDDNRDRASCFDVLANVEADVGLFSQALSHRAAPALAILSPDHGPPDLDERTQLRNLAWLLIHLESPPPGEPGGPDMPPIDEIGDLDRYRLQGIRDLARRFSALASLIQDEKDSRTLFQEAHSVEGGTPALVARRIGEVLFRISLDGATKEGNEEQALSDLNNLAWVTLFDRDYPETTRQLKEIEARLNAVGQGEATGSYDRLRLEHWQLDLELALALGDGSHAEQVLDGELECARNVFHSKELLPEASAVLQEWDLSIYKGRTLELKGDLAGALRCFRQGLEQVREASADAARVGYAPGFLMANRAPLDHLLTLLPLDSSEAFDRWLEAYHSGTTVPWEGWQPGGLAKRDNEKYGAYLKALDALAAHERQRSTLAKNEEDSWKKNHDRLRAAKDLEFVELMKARNKAVLDLHGQLPPLEPVDRARLEALLAEDAEVWVMASLPHVVRGLRIRGGQPPIPFEHVIERSDLLNARNQVVGALENSHRPPSAALSELVAMLPPGVPREIRRVVLLPDPFLDGLPFEILPSKEGLWVDRVDSFSYASDLASLTRTLERPLPTWILTPVVMADADPDPFKKLSGAEKVADAFPDIFSASRGGVFPANVLTFTGQTATYDNILACAPKASPLHLSVHGRSDPLDPASASLELFDEPLSVAELSRLGLPGGLVYLAACQSGSGGRTGASLARASLEGGAAAVISSRWDLPDKAGAEAAILFYRNMVAGSPPAEALTRALKDLDVDENVALAVRAGLWYLGDPGWRR